MSDNARGTSGDVKDLLKRLTSQGFTYEETAKCRYKVYSPAGALVAVLGGKPGDWRALRNTVSWLRKAGFKRVGE
jgi:hypothetical protein